MSNDQKKKTGRQNYDWATIMIEYVTDPKASLRGISKKYNIPYDTVAKKSKADSWFATRKKHQSRVISKAISKAADKQANELAKEMDFLTLMKGHMDRMLSDEEQFQRQLITNPLTGDTEERVTAKFDSRALKDSMQTLKMIEEMSRSLYNIQKAEAIQRRQLEADRLQLEREKFEFEKQKAELARPDSSNSIKVEGFEKGWSE